MQATAERVMGGGFRQNSVSELKLKTGVQDPRKDTPRSTYVKLQIRQKVYYRSGMVNSKSFIGKVLLRIKWKFKLTYTL